ncbi:MAG TPA: GNAT family N-acetyltransferase [Aggregatilineales bacterium]|nr:GNAT family N-acetyltransferase [Anaerolineales bacterium]HRE48420.1 GNAT family N-acetyltransferase [Aggregatilineales bacterium]
MTTIDKPIEGYTEATGVLRNAHEGDIQAIQGLIKNNLDKLLPRTDEEIRELLSTWWVVEEAGVIVGCCCLEIYSPKIAELRTVAVREDCRGKGYGALLIKRATHEADQRKIPQVLVVTSSPEYFQALDFGQCLNEKYALFWQRTTK